MKTINLKSHDEFPLNCYLWDDVQNPKGILQIAHGMGEHAGRYQRFAKFLNANGYIVFADDHRAHGLSESDKNRGHHKGDIFSKTVKDHVFIFNYLKEKFNLPIFFLGYSYGSFLGQALLQTLSLQGVILLGSAYMPRFLSGMGTVLLSPLQLFIKSAKPKLIGKLSDKLFSMKYKGEKGKSLWITRDEREREILIADTMAGIPMSINFTFSMVKGIFNLNKKSNLQKVNKETPVFLISGDKDPIGGYGKKVQALYQKYKALGAKVQIKLYKDCRHELLNELNYKDIFKDILNFLNKYV